MAGVSQVSAWLSYAQDLLKNEDREMSRNIPDGAHRKSPPTKGIHALSVFVGALLIPPALLFSFLAWRRAMQSGEVIWHFQGVSWMVCIWVVLSLCATGMMLPFSRLSRWMAVMSGAVLAPLLGVLAWMLYNLR